jgi:macrolide transport system ATP-binding/permease protein
MPLSDLVFGTVRPILLTLLGGAGLLLLIACVNVASLMLVRSETRRREVAVRGALGATRARLVRQFITEGLLLAAVGSTAGIVTAGWLMVLLKGLVPKSMADGMPFLAGVSLNAHAMMLASAICVLMAFADGRYAAAEDLAGTYSLRALRWRPGRWRVDSGDGWEAIWWSPSSQ